MAEFAIFMRENDHAWARMAPEQQQQILEHYYAWVRDLRARDIFRYGQPLSDTGRILRTVDGEVVDSPFVETKEVLTGLFVVEAADLEAAVAIARGCPALGHGETVEVRPIGHV